MAKYRKIYGMNGLLEWHGVIDSGGVKMRVSFTNGSTSAFGVAPASFTTEKELTQHIIENSDLFKSGRIFIVMSTLIPGTEDDDKPNVKNTTPSDDTSKPSDEGESSVDGAEGVGVKKTQVKVSSVEDAKDYLVDRFGIAGSKLRTRAACIAAGEENGIEFVWI